jgi:hypothetical protein
MVFENRVLRKIFGPKREEGAGGWRKLQNEGLHNVYSFPNINRVLKSRWMGWSRHVACVEGMINANNNLVGKTEGKKHAEDLGVDGKSILERILGKYGGKM